MPRSSTSLQMCTFPRAHQILTPFSSGQSLSSSILRSLRCCLMLSMHKYLRAPWQSCKILSAIHNRLLNSCGPFKNLLAYPVISHQESQFSGLQSNAASLALQSIYPASYLQQIFVQSAMNLILKFSFLVWSRLLQRTDWFTQEKACTLLTILLDCRPSKEASAGSAQAGPSSSSGVSAEGVEHTLVSFVDWLCSQLR